MTDLISRADAIEAVWKLDKDANEYVVDDAKEIHGYCTAIGVCVGELSALPSAEAVHKPDYSYEADMVRRLKELLSAEDEDRLYIKIYADDEPSVKAEKLYQICGETQNKEVAKWLKEYFPSAEAVQGEWESLKVVDISRSGVQELQEQQCSHCGKWLTTPYMYYPKKHNFCPNCGARMTPYKGGEPK